MPRWARYVDGLLRRPILTTAGTVTAAAACPSISLTVPKFMTRAQGPLSDQCGRRSLGGRKNHSSDVSEQTSNAALASRSSTHDSGQKLTPLCRKLEFARNLNSERRSAQSYSSAVPELGSCLPLRPPALLWIPRRLQSTGRSTKILERGTRSCSLHRGGIHRGAPWVCYSPSSARLRIGDGDRPLFLPDDAAERRKHRGAPFVELRRCRALERFLPPPIVERVAAVQPDHPAGIV